MSTDRKYEDDEVRELFSAADATLTGPTPYVHTRILAHWRDAQSKTRIRLWKRLALAGPVLSGLLLLTLWWQSPPSSFRASVHEKVLVRVEVQAIQDVEIAYAEVELPDNVHFYSEKYPELSAQREIRLAWAPFQALGSLPIVIQSSTAGVKQVKVRFFDAKERLMQERNIAIHFETLLQQGSIFLSRGELMQERKIHHEV